MTLPNLSDPDTYLNGPPHELWRTLRAEQPVYWNSLGNTGYWAILRHADVLRVGKDPETFWSSRGVAHLSRGDTMAPPDVKLYPPGPRNLILLDAPDHGPFRRVVSRAFTPAVIASLEPQVVEIVDDVFRELKSRGEADFSIDVAARIATSTLCELLGAPREDWKFIWEITQGMNNPDDPEIATRETAMQVSIESLQKSVGYFSELLQSRKRFGGQALFNRLLDARDSETISEADFVLLCNTLITAGHDPVRNAMTCGVLALYDHPDQKALLTQNLDLLDSAVEEILRWSSPLMTFGRFAAKDAEIRGQQITAGQRVVMFFASANRDEDVFRDPFVFDIRRDPNPHLAFSSGPHTCLGATLARMQLKVTLRKLLTELPSLSVVGPPEWLRSNFVSGIKHLPVRVEARA